MRKADCEQCKVENLGKNGDLFCKTCSLYYLLNNNNKDSLFLKSIESNKNFSKRNSILFKNEEYIKKLNQQSKLFDFKNFEINKKDLIGKGAFSEVYKTLNKISNTTFAIKIVKTN